MREHMLGVALKAYEEFHKVLKEHKAPKTPEGSKNPRRARFQMTHLESVLSQTLLSLDERNCLFFAYKRSFEQRLAEFQSTLCRGREEGGEKNEEGAERIKKEMDAICAEFLSLISDKLLSDRLWEEMQKFDKEALVWYLKMRADFYTLLCGYDSVPVVKKEDAIEEDAIEDAKEKKAEEAYSESYKVASEHLSPAHPTRLNLALNFSIFQYKILGNRKNAFKILSEAHTDGEAHIAEVEDESFREESEMTLHLIDRS